MNIPGFTVHPDCSGKVTIFENAPNKNRCKAFTAVRERDGSLLIQEDITFNDCESPGRHDHGVRSNVVVDSEMIALTQKQTEAIRLLLNSFDKPAEMKQETQSKNQIIDKSLMEETRELLLRHRQEVEVLGAKVRDELVIPFCKKFGMEFYHSTKNFYFTKVLNGVTITFSHGNRQANGGQAEILRALVPVFKVLNQEVDEGVPLGDYVEEYFTTDPKAT